LSVELPKLDPSSSQEEREQFVEYARELSRDQIHKSLNQTAKLLQIYDHTGAAPAVLLMMKEVLQAELESRPDS